LTSEEEYRAKAAEVLATLADATSEQQRVQIRRAHAAYLKLATHRTEAVARAELKPARIVPEKPAAPKPDGRQAIAGITWK